MGGREDWRLEGEDVDGREGDQREAGNGLVSGRNTSRGGRVKMPGERLIAAGEVHVGEPKDQSGRGKTR